MSLKVLKLIPLIIVTLLLVIGLAIMPHFPNSVASHWNMYGQVDGYMSRFWGLMFLPMTSIFLYIILLGLPLLPSYQKSFKEFEIYYYQFLIVVFTFLLYIYLLTIFWNLGYVFNMMQFLAPVFSLLFYFVGVLCQHTKRNWFVGIRTPWTLKSSKVWQKTHVLGAQLFKFSAAMILLALLFPRLAFYFIFIPIIGTTVAVLIYSWWIS